MAFEDHFVEPGCFSVDGDGFFGVCRHGHFVGLDEVDGFEVDVVAAEGHRSDFGELPGVGGLDEIRVDVAAGEAGIRGGDKWAGMVSPVANNEEDGFPLVFVFGGFDGELEGLDVLH